MINYRAELQAFVDAAASFTEPALGHHRAWAEAVARARVALSVPESSANTACSITPPPDLIEDWIEIAKPLPQRPPNPGELATLAARWGADQELEACCEWLGGEGGQNGWPIPAALTAARRPKPLSLKELALKVLPAQTPGLSTSVTLHPDDIALVRRALEKLDD